MAKCLWNLLKLKLWNLSFDWPAHFCHGRNSWMSYMAASTVGQPYWAVFGSSNLTVNMWVVGPSPIFAWHLFQPKQAAGLGISTKMDDKLALSISAANTRASLLQVLDDFQEVWCFWTATGITHGSWLHDRNGALCLAILDVWNVWIECEGPISHFLVVWSYSVCWFVAQHFSIF